MGGKGSGRKRRCIRCNEPLVCAACGQDQNVRPESDMEQVSLRLSRELLEECRKESRLHNIPLAEVIRKKLEG